MRTRVAVCQLATEDLAVKENRSRVRARVTALDEDVELAVFPEYALTGFVADERLESTALARDASALEEISSLAVDTETALVVGFVEAADDALYNATAYVGPGGDLTVYRKRHLWGGERDVLSPGSDLVTVETSLGTAGLMTCYDLNFVTDSAALAREEVTALLVVGAWPAAYSENWRLLCRARALDGVRWVVGANRTGQRDVPGTEPTTYGGRSLVARPDGGIHRELDRQERTLVTTLDAAVLTAQRDLVGVFDD